MTPIVFSDESPHAALRAMPLKIVDSGLPSGDINQQSEISDDVVLVLVWMHPRGYVIGIYSKRKGIFKK